MLSCCSAWHPWPLTTQYHWCIAETTWFHYNSCRFYANLNPTYHKYEQKGVYTIEVTFKARKCYQDSELGVVRTLETFSHVCSCYRMALYFCIADYISKVNPSVVTRNSSFVDKGLREIAANTRVSSLNQTTLNSF